MNLEPAPRLPKWIFLAIDAALLLAAFLIISFAQDPYAPLPFASAVICVTLAAVIALVPFLVDYAADTAEAVEAERHRLNEQAVRLAATVETLARTAAHIKAVEEAVHKSAREAETLPYRMQEKLAEFNEALAAKEDSDREALETELEQLRSTHTEQLKAVADKIAKAAADWSALEVATRKQLAATEASLAKLSTAAAATAAQIESATAATPAKLDTHFAAATAKLDSHVAAALREIDARLDALKAAAAAIPASVTITTVATPATTPSTAPQAAAGDSSADATEPPAESAHDAPTADASADLLGAAADAPKPKKPRAPRKPRHDEAPAAPAESTPATEPDSAAPAPEITPAPEATGEPVTAEPVATEPAPAETAAPVAPAEEPAPTPEPEPAVSEESSAEVAAGPVESSTSSDGATRLLATAYIGIGNKLFIRGDGPGLSWDHGVPMQFVSIGKWGWFTHEASGPIRCKLYKNDETAALTGEIVLEAGRHTEVTALF